MEMRANGQGGASRTSRLPPRAVQSMGLSWGKRSSCSSTGGLSRWERSSEGESAAPGWRKVQLFAASPEWRSVRRGGPCKNFRSLGEWVLGPLLSRIAAPLAARATPSSPVTDSRQVFSTTFSQPSRLFWNRSYPRGASSSWRLWVMTKLGSISPRRIRSSSGFM
jgi:hypothetical protein